MINGQPLVPNTDTTVSYKRYRCTCCGQTIFTQGEPQPRPAPCVECMRWAADKLTSLWRKVQISERKDARGTSLQ